MTFPNFDTYLDRYLTSLTDIANTKRLCADSANRDPVFEYSMWQPSSLANGLLGASTVLFALSHQDKSLINYAHKYLVEAIEAKSFAGIGTMSGLSGVLYVLNVAQGAGVRGYKTLRENIITKLVSDSFRLLQLCERDPSSLSWESYDIMNGLSSVAMQLLKCRDQEAAKVAQAIARYLTSRVCVPSKDLLARPSWSIPPENEPTELDKQMYPYGDANLGMAHGIAGVLAYLAHYVEFNELRSGSEFIDHMLRVADMLRSYEITIESATPRDAYRAFPARLYIGDDNAIQLEKSKDTRAAWCYGTPGVSCAIYQVGRVVNRMDLSASAETLLLSHLSAPRDAYNLDGPTLCHGYGGLAMVLDRFWKWTNNNVFRSQRDKAINILWEQFYETDSPFGFRHWMPDSKNGWRDAQSYRKINSVGLLEGSSGIALLYESVTGSISEGIWRSCFGTD